MTVNTLIIPAKLHKCSRSVKFEDQGGLAQDAGSVRSLLSGKGMTQASFTWNDVPLLVVIFVRMFALGCSAGGRTWIRGLWTVDTNSLRLLSRSLTSACQGIQEMAHSSARMRTHGRTVGVSLCTHREVIQKTMVRAGSVRAGQEWATFDLRRVQVNLIIMSLIRTSPFISVQYYNVVFWTFFFCFVQNMTSLS